MRKRKMLMPLTIFLKWGFFFIIFCLLQTRSVHADELDIVTYNVFMLPPIANAFQADFGNKQRASLIAEADFIKGHDILILDEVFDNNARKILLDGLRSEYPYQTPVVGGDDSVNQFNENSLYNYYANFTNGGVVILSKWPFVKTAQHVYGKMGYARETHPLLICGADAFSNKGFAYVRFSKNGKYYNVIGTHTQASDSACSNPAQVRKQQFKDISDFIKNKEIPNNEMLIIAGDLNVNKNNRTEFADMLRVLNVSEPTWLPSDGSVQTYEPGKNGITGYKDGVGEKQEYLDYIFVEKNHAQPASWHNITADFASKQFYTDKGNLTKGNFWATEYTDHFPVRGFTGKQGDFVGTTAWPLKSTRSSVYDNIQLRNIGAGKYVGFRQVDSEAWLRAAEGKADSDTRWIISNNMAVKSSGCIRNNDYVRFESNFHKGRNWILGDDVAQLATYRYHYRLSFADSNQSRYRYWLQIRIKNTISPDQCLKHGDKINFYDNATSNYYYIEADTQHSFSTGYWKDYLYLGNRGPDDARTIFEISMDEPKVGLSNILVSPFK